MDFGPTGKRGENRRKMRKLPFLPIFDPFLGQFRHRPKGVFGKGVGNSKNASEMRQTCVKNASKWVLFHWEKGNVPKCVRNCVEIASKMRGTPLGENTFWTMPTIFPFFGHFSPLKFLSGGLKSIFRPFFPMSVQAIGIANPEWDFSLQGAYRYYYPADSLTRPKNYCDSGINHDRGNYQRYRCCLHAA